MRSETVAIATNYLDRYLSRRSCESVDLQLAATASIFLASKVEEQRHFHEHAPSPTDVFAAEPYERSPKKKQRVA